MTRERGARGVKSLEQNRGFWMPNADSNRMVRIEKERASKLKSEIKDLKSEIV
jgi:hypothetical protein